MNCAVIFGKAKELNSYQKTVQKYCWAKLNDKNDEPVPAFLKALNNVYETSPAKAPIMDSITSIAEEAQVVL
jgi:hypothetical protein